MAELGTVELGSDVSFMFPVGRTDGFVIPEVGQQPNALLIPGAALTTVTGLEAGSPPTPTLPGTDRADQLLVPVTGGIPDWFDRIHVLPRTKLEFGNILTQVDRNFEIYNSHRTDSTTLLSITNNATPGIELPNLSAPTAVPPQTSILNPSSTFNPPVPVQDVIRALQDGLSNFDSSVVFTFSTGEVVPLLVSGSRISMLTAPFESVEEALLFFTEILASISGIEQRISPRSDPRQTFDVEFALTDDERQRFNTLMFGWQDKLFGLPLWHEQIDMTAASIVGATQYQVTGAADVDFRVGGLAVVMSDSQTFDVLDIVAVTNTLITASSSSLNAYPAGTKIFPLRTVHMLGNLRGAKHPVTLETFSARFQSTDNHTGALAGDTTGQSTYNGKVLFDDCNVMSGSQMSETWVKKLYRQDTVAGLTGQISQWATNRRKSEKGFIATSRADILSLRKLILALRGRQKSFYLPTFSEDLTVTSDLASGLFTMDITNIGYTRFEANQERMQVFKVTFDDGTSLVREVQSSAIVDAQTERLTLDSAWPTNRTVSEIVRIQFYELSRFDTDRMVFKYARIGLAMLVAPVISIFEP